MSSGYQLTDKWWEKYVPREGESFRDFIDRVGDYLEMNLVLFKTEIPELVEVASAYRINRFHYAFKENCYTVLILRDLVFVNYSLEWEAGIA